MKNTIKYGLVPIHFREGSLFKFPRCNFADENLLIEYQNYTQSCSKEERSLRSWYGCQTNGFRM